MATRRAADPGRRQACLRYAAGVCLVQIGWVLRLLVPDRGGMVGFLVLVVAELAVPIFGGAQTRRP